MKTESWLISLHLFNILFILFLLHSFKTQDCNNALQNMKQHHCNFTSNSKHSEFFGADEQKQAESTDAKEHCNNLLQSMKQGE